MDDENPSIGKYTNAQIVAKEELNVGVFSNKRDIAIKDDEDDENEVTSTEVSINESMTDESLDPDNAKVGVEGSNPGVQS